MGGKKLTGWGKNGPAYFFPGERMGRPILSPGKKLTGGKFRPVTPEMSDGPTAIGEHCIGKFNNLHWKQSNCLLVLQHEALAMASGRVDFSSSVSTGIQSNIWAAMHEPVFRVSNKVRFKLVCSATETS